MIREVLKAPKLYWFLALMVWTDFETNIYYALFVCAMFLFFITKGIAPFFVKQSKEDTIVRSFVIVWMYGLLLGCLMGNNKSYIIANFAGMMCYMSYFFLVRLNADVNTVIKILMIGGCIMSIYAILRIVSFWTGIHFPGIEVNIGLASTGQFRIYFTNLSLIYPLLGLTLICSISKLKNTFIKYNIIWLLLATFTIFIVSGSKGFMLGGLWVYGFILVLYYWTKMKKGYLDLKMGLVVLLLPLLYIVLENSGYINILTEMFDREDGSNVERYDQLGMMLKDLTFWGKGLGATIPGALRSEEAPYGFELTFLNIIHKFGVLSLFLFYGWLYMFKKSIKLYTGKQTVIIGGVVLSSLGYLCPAIGNPTLMHPSVVVMNSMALYILRCSNKVNL